jgi:hypothetical protein
MKGQMRPLSNPLLVFPVVFAVFALASCGDDNQPKPAQIRFNPIHAELSTDSNPWSDGTGYSKAVEICFKGVTYVVFSPNWNGSVGATEHDRNGNIVRCEGDKQ